MKKTRTIRERAKALAQLFVRKIPLILSSVAFLGATAHGSSLSLGGSFSGVGNQPITIFPYPIPLPLWFGTSRYGDAFSFQIPLLNLGSATYSASGLPAGLSLDPASGLVSGTLADAGNFVLGLSCISSSGTTGMNYYLTVQGRLTVSGSGAGTVSPDGVSYFNLNTPILFAYPDNGSGFLSTNSTGITVIGGSPLPTVTLTASPQSGYRLLAWQHHTIQSGSSSAVGSETINPVTPTLTGPDEYWTAEFIPWSQCAGDYYGLIPGTDGAGHHSGKLHLTVTKKGSLSGNYELDGRTFPFSGVFDIGNSYTMSFPRINSTPLTITLRFDSLTAHATLTDGTWVQSIDVIKIAPFTNAQPCPFTGYYTAALYPNTDSLHLIPGGTGLMTLRIFPGGVARLVGVLPFGVSFSFSGRVSSEDWTLPLATTFSQNAGTLSGTLQLGSSDQAQGIFSGTLNVLKIDNTPNPLGRATIFNAVGAVYHPLDLMPGTTGSLAIRGLPVSGSVIAGFKLNALHNVVLNPAIPHALTFHLDDSTGTFYGKFKDGQTTRHYLGLLLTQQTVSGVPLQPVWGAGFFNEETEPAAVELNFDPLTPLP